MDKKFHLVIDAYLLAPDLDEAFRRIRRHFDDLHASLDLSEYDSVFIPPSTLTLQPEEPEATP